MVNEFPSTINPTTAPTTFTSSSWDASSNYQWQSQTIHCTPNQACTVLCDRDGACQYSTIICPENATCNITCSSYEACEGVCSFIILY